MVEISEEEIVDKLNNKFHFYYDREGRCASSSGTENCKSLR